VEDQGLLEAEVAVDRAEAAEEDNFSTIFNTSLSYEKTHILYHSNHNYGFRERTNRDRRIALCN
tara:strand:- start:35 stop:226 length:192 start_codon:yes stop_codon:yes gene_type:complete